MEIRVSKTVYDKINLSEENVKEVTKAKLRSMLNGQYIRYKNKEAWVCEDEDSYHGSIGTEYLRRATPLEVSIYEVIKAV